MLIALDSRRGGGPFRKGV